MLPKIFRGTLKTTDFQSQFCYAEISQNYERDFPLREQWPFAFTVRTTRPEKCEIFAQRYQSQPITTKLKKNTANIC